MPTRDAFQFLPPVQLSLDHGQDRLASLHSVYASSTFEAGDCAGVEPAKSIENERQTYVVAAGRVSLVAG
ncbi:uncharacterized protein EHS24_009135 [Apiotrichum porosum]|uniref:Uncharacterized protein n=1 Tax=Apiotrichum porosum TaxID=105984 RepID=A0A427XP11_9TREE|nr:uncharacterized protein EHS24_009135 [Apiotrichum porosum]RSH80553.1 hypothetical protein EHS24_009135 [Apiotrichum porosum]